MSESPEREVARLFMEQRGYDVDPMTSERVDDDFCWYFYYELPEGLLELEVSWSQDDGWQSTVTDFKLD